MINWKEEEPVHLAKNWPWNISAINLKQSDFYQKEADGYYQPFEINEGKQINEGTIFYN